MKTRACLLKAVCFAFDCRRMAAYDPKKDMNIVEDAILDNVTEDNRFFETERGTTEEGCKSFQIQDASY